MKVTQTTLLQRGSLATAGKSDLVDASQDRPAERRAVIGGGWITTPAVAAHVRSKMADTGQHNAQNQPAERKAVIGGGWITTPAVAAHVRRKMANTGQRSI